ncbi:MAG: leucine--tRNA ligase [Saprospiraceae bacterium]|nr:leucine--tRNA ligase [Saprospiraceae bacterium]
MQYQPEKVEKKWKQYWVDNKVYKVDIDTSKPKFYVLDMFPYPSGAGLHVGHPLGYIASDIVARYKRLKGFNVLHPMGYDAFGLPAEQYAIQTGVHPEVSTAENIARYRSQLDNIGFSFDWSREVNTSDPKYYKWTQWIFLQLFASWYDKNSGKAQPISVLISRFEEGGSSVVNAAHSNDRGFSSEEWKNMSDIDKDQILMNYRLAYRKVGYVNWCEALGTVLANDEIKDGLSERGGHPVEKKAMTQWSLRITAYAERLLNELEHLEWSDALKTMQRNWIGRSEGARVFFKLENFDDTIEIFTTRPDTIFGSTFMVLAPEHELVPAITTAAQKVEIENYKNYVSSRSERDRMSDVKEVTGAFTGANAIHPITGEKIPVWIGEYVLKDYGTGAIMAVPSDDERDKVFAEKFGLTIIPVVDKSNYPGAGIHDKTGIMINSGFINGLEVKEAIQRMLDYIESNGLGRKEINYKLRDANFSRQRYWGEPFPIRYDEEGVACTLDEDVLPLVLPELENFLPATDGRSPLARAEQWVHETPGFVRETDTMPGFAGSSWYFLRYMDPNNENEFASGPSLEYWKDVDLYVGGTEHAVGHLMYSRFWHKFLFDIGKVPTREPFLKLINQGMIQGVIEYLFMKKEKVNGQTVFTSAEIVRQKDSEDGYTKIPVHVDFVRSGGANGSYLDIKGILKFTEWRPEFANAVFESGNGYKGTAANFLDKDSTDEIKIYLVSEIGKMSKRYFNVVNPDDVVARYGADCFRMYEMFLGPIEQSKPWDTKGIEGVQKFLRKFWSLFFDDEKWLVNDTLATAEEKKVLHTTIKKVCDDIERFSLNTSVSAFMVCVNELKRLECHTAEILEPLVRLLAPFAPFITEELWQNLGNSSSVHKSTYPVYNPEFLTSDTVEYPVCVNGKKRDMIEVSKEMSAAEIENMVMAMDMVQKWLEGKAPKKIIIVPDRMINIVV